ncbi:pyridoxal-phosphate dependent enzyme [Variovorax sp. EBFNA2]|uniref:threonine synthase n=1 Tax=Variovorax sp. EBFNA2 TaxID=3342097 RepID=UPI0029C09BDE|nr:pyridoxal-phosphate dependent enzyme [Variovorax boronicumulans]WPG38962.1 pyridoxal-phosphate dependent enzyme [Variovorax boronicumulans]
MTPSPVLDFKFTAPPESPAQTFLPGRPAGVLGRSFTPERNPRLQGLQCLRCDTLYPVSLANDGCPACRQAGFHVGLRASYRPGGPDVVPMPYVQGFSLGEGHTPQHDMPALAEQFGVARLSIKDESRNPTGSPKDRLTAMGVAQALDAGAHTLVLASSGNTAVSAAHYAWAAGLGCEVATYEAMPATYARQLDALGARRYVFADNTGRWGFVRERSQYPGYFALTNYRLPALGNAPLGVEGYKAIAEECLQDGGLPDHVVVPTGRGDMAWGIYAGFRELLAAGRIARLPRMWLVEPFPRLSRVLEGGALNGSYPGRTAQLSSAGATVTYLQWQAATASGGGAVVVGDDEARAARRLLTAAGVSAELAAAAGLGAVRQLREAETIAADAHVVLVLTSDASSDPSWPDRAVTA